MVVTNMDPLDWLRKKMSEDDADMTRELIREFAQRLMSAEADALCGAPHGTRSPDRVNQRNGYRPRTWDTRAGTIELAIPKLRQGSYFPSWLLQARRRAEKALVTVVAECYVNGVSVRSVENVAEALGITGLSKSQVSEMAKCLDETVAAFRERPLDGGPYPYLWLDALVLKCREAGRVVNVVLVAATGVNADGHREILGLDVVTSEDGTAWLNFLRSLVARGLSGVRNVTSDAHPGLRNAIAATLPGASWQRCRTHAMRNVLTRVPKHAQAFVATLVRSVFAQPSPEEVHAQYGRVVEQLEQRFPKVSQMLVDTQADLLAFTAFPKEHWKQIWSNNPQERLNKEIRRRTDVVGIFPNRDAIIRLVGAVLAEQNDEWAVARRYLSVESLAKLEKKDEDGDREAQELLGAGEKKSLDQAA